MKKVSFKTVIIPVIVSFALLQPGCKKSSMGSPYAVRLETSMSHGQYLVDNGGYTLYMFANDYQGRTSCTGSCSGTWPPFYVANLTQTMLGSGLAISDFDTIMVNGSPQLRYKTWPLYYYAPGTGYYGGNVREQAGQINGDGQSGLWFVAKPDYSVMLDDGQLVGLNGLDYLSNDVPGNGNTEYLSDAKGAALYIFTRDSLNINKFTKSDFSNNSLWPIYQDTNFVIPSYLDKTLFSKIKVFGLTQVTYNGWPIYYFGADKLVHGNNKGVSVPTPGVWKVVVKDLTRAPG